MPTYQMPAPDGKTYQIDGPEGATDEQVKAEIIKQNPHLAEPVQETPPQPQWQRPPSEGILGAAYNRLKRGGETVANAIYPAAPQAPVSNWEALKRAAIGVGGGLMEAASAPFAPIGELVRPAGEALHRATARTPEQMQQDIAAAEDSLKRAFMANDSIWIHNAQVYLENLRKSAALSPEEREYLTGQAAATSAELLSGMMFPGKGIAPWSRAAAPAETGVAKFLPRTMRRSLQEIPKPLPPEKTPVVDMSKLQEPGVNPTISQLEAMSPIEAARMGWYRGAEGGWQRGAPTTPRPFQPEPTVLERPAPEPAPAPEPPLRTAAERAQERTGGVIPPPEEPVSPILSPQGRQIRRMPEPGQGTAERVVSPPVEEIPAIRPTETRNLPTAKTIAEERTGGLIEPKFEPGITPEARTRQLGREAESEIEQALRQGIEQPETPTQRLIREGKSITGGSANEDVGWVKPDGTVASHTGIKAPSQIELPNGGFEMTHSEALSALHGEDDFGAAFSKGFVRYARSGDHLAIEVGPTNQSIDNAIRFIQQQRPKYVSLDVTAPDGRLLNGILEDRPYKIIQELETYRPAAEGRTLRKPPPISGGSDSGDGWLKPTGEFVAHSPYEGTTHHLAAQKAGFDDVYDAMQSGWVRIAQTPQELNIQLNISNPQSIKDAVRFIESNARGRSVVLDSTVVDQRAYGGNFHDIYDRPYKAINALKDVLTRIETPTQRIIRTGKGISGGAEGYEVKVHFGTSNEPRVVGYAPTEEAAMREARAYLSDSKGVWVTKPNGEVVDVKAAATRPVRRPPQISGGSEGVPEGPMPSAREIAMRRAPKEEAAPVSEIAPAPEIAAEKPPLGSSAKTTFTPQQLEETLVARTTTPPPTAKPKTPAGSLRKSWEKFKTMLPQEYAVLRARPNSPVITEMEQWLAQQAHRMDHIVKQSWWNDIKTMDPEMIKDLEASAVKIYQETGDLEKSIASWPESLKEYVRFRNENLAMEQAARDTLGMQSFKELPGPYLPHITDAELSDVLNIRQASSESLLQTSVKGAAEHRKIPTMREGEAGGFAYIDPRNAILLREYNGIKATSTADLIKALEQRGGIFKDRAAAVAASPTKEAFELTGLPGAETWYTPTRAEALFIRQNVVQAPRGLRVPGVTGAKNLADVTMRNPNLVNPLPHAVKNMGLGKYLFARGPSGLATAVPDTIEYARFLRADKAGEAVPEIYRQFRELMPYAEADPAYGTLSKALVAQLTNPLKMVERVGEFLNTPSKKFIFHYADPGLRYSLFKRYVKAGMQPQEAANHAWIDLVRYGTRSDLTDMWKSIPFNFFVPWRVGTYTSVAKAVIGHPFRTAMTIAGIDALRELRYRQSGRWTHWPHDYIEGPIVLALEHLNKGELSSIGWEATVNAAFGPGGEQTAKSLARLIAPPRIAAGESDTEPGTVWERFKNFISTWWGLSQIAESLQEGAELFMKEGNPSRLMDALATAVLSEREAQRYDRNDRLQGHPPHRVMEAIPNRVLRRSSKVQAKEAEAEK